LESGDHSLVLHAGGRERRYLVHVPCGYDGRRPVPVVLMFHGAGGTAELAKNDTGWADKADREGFLVVFPEGTRPDPSRPATFRTNPQIWQGPPRQQGHRPPVDDIGFVRGILDELEGAFLIDTHRLFATGFSNGAAFCFFLATQLSRRLAAIGPVAGLCRVKEPKLERPVPTIFLIGTRDPLVPLHGGEVKSPWEQRPVPRPAVRDSILTWARANGCPLGPQTTEEKDGVRVETFGPCAAGAELKYCTIEGLGHFWPGGPANLSERLAGKPSMKLRATEVIWDFFRHHPHR
jgi:polyhydroxybutyrate depolymerase